jgi:pSer/pThr/pTyr-binding forkhead associated (FHA) protein
VSTFIPAYPRLDAILRADATGELMLNGTSRQLVAPTVEQLRAGIITRCASTASTVRRPVRLHVTDIEGTYSLAIHPDSLVQELAPDGTVPDLNPTEPRYVGVAPCRVCEHAVPLNVTRCPNCGASDPLDVAAPPTSANKATEATDPALVTTEISRSLLDRWSDAAPEPAPVAVAPEPAPPAPRSSVLDPEDEQTVIRVRRAPARLLFTTGQMLTVKRSALVGRGPSPAAGETADTLFSVDDPTKSVSRTHFRLDWVDRHLIITDRDSANGVIVNDGPRLTRGASVELHDGDHVAVGDQAFTVQATS